ncbi:MmcQ/YjbR family DNA-binding protein [Streptomyces lunaelactis]|uniref:MmcQ/YjbR family DNA-binding protein n=1 Tax=Streptomyces lunaelactis TaxID=1535768 RepID=UPI001585887D|nr:MmcQ/YjbR family DNA-binding protein [Streptomyces lunaelactis]NUK04811.1 MmcQ/YjbR family DNA-binding protein [Streptomyces lunaelactis]NUK19229.1 MmcQ/YjbR family DNA-binding protein [Streptomyces lunaelactis]NUK28095.1 MmcQ/YjbR family DNA-binding protein [Streptomyces lunaelactis]NUK59522.1 MmcQ/YjbR family DNA-binding protein [Streptomyces lunaelactis]NUK74938.1 MmcQ/YjbR family DNA-binding protein [Streptomyces lunaelactis]
MTPAEFRAFCLQFNAAVEEFPFGPETSVFKVHGKVFALSGLDAEPLKVNLKCEPEIAERLRAEHAGIVPGYHMNKRHWNTVTVRDLPDGMVRELIEDSYDLVVAGLPRATRLRLDRP